VLLGPAFEQLTEADRGQGLALFSSAGSTSEASKAQPQTLTPKPCPSSSRLLTSGLFRFLRSPADPMSTSAPVQKELKGSRRPP